MSCANELFAININSRVSEREGQERRGPELVIGISRVEVMIT
jgi:hypothetical protein